MKGGFTLGEFRNSEFNWIRNPNKHRDFNAPFPQQYPGLVAGVLFILWIIVSLAN